MEAFNADVVITQWVFAFVHDTIGTLANYLYRSTRIFAVVVGLFML